MLLVVRLIWQAETAFLWEAGTWHLLPPDNCPVSELWTSHLFPTALHKALVTKGAASPTGAGAAA